MDGEVDVRVVVRQVDVGVLGRGRAVQRPLLDEPGDPCGVPPDGIVESTVDVGRGSGPHGPHRDATRQGARVPRGRRFPELWWFLTHGDATGHGGSRRPSATAAVVRAVAAVRGGCEGRDGRERSTVALPIRSARRVGRTFTFSRPTPTRRSGASVGGGDRRGSAAGDLGEPRAQLGNHAVLQGEELIEAAVDRDARVGAAGLDAENAGRNSQLVSQALESTGDDPRDVQLPGEVTRHLVAQRERRIWAVGLQRTEEGLSPAP